MLFRSVLVDDEARIGRATRMLLERGEPLAPALQAHAARLEGAGRRAEARRLEDAAREAWRATLLALGFLADDATIEQAMRQGAAAADLEQVRA